VLAITGTNGKTTTTALTGALARAAGLATRVAGNIGTPVLDTLAGIEEGAPWPDLFVLELSSYQLETTGSLKLAAAAVLNVSANHLDRYAGLADYAAAKARILAHCNVAILNRDDPVVRLMRRRGDTVQTFGASVPQSEEEWGLVPRAGGEWLARGGELFAAGARTRAARPSQRAERARRARTDRGGGAHSHAGDRRAEGVRRTAAPDAGGRRCTRRHVHRRFQGDDGGGDRSRARRQHAPGDPDRGR
jgi:hypothetical protein